jgi:glycosyltransferase involved in cell wall biosynthesis
MKILINVEPLSSGHAVRGVGMYTRFLTQALEELKDIKVFRSGLPERPKKVDINHYPFFDLFFPTLPILKRGKTVVTIHDVIPLIFPEHYPVGKRGKLAFVHQKLALKTADGVITDSETSKRDIMTYLNVPADKIFVVQLAANPHLQPATAKKQRSARRKLKLPKKYILYVGDINYNKNIPQLIKSLKYLPEEIKLVCVGRNFKEQDIPEWQAVESQLALSNVTKRVKFITDILSDDYKTLSAVFSAAKAYVQPSLYEGFGLPVLEAMHCQTPVVAARNSSLIEVGGEAVRFVGNTAQEIAEGVEEILKMNKTERKKIINKASAWESKFTWQKTAKETVKVYQQL